MLKFTRQSRNEPRFYTDVDGVTMPIYDAQGNPIKPAMDYTQKLMGEEPVNQTRVDAFRRVQKARTTSFRDASTEYLEALRTFILGWEAEVAKAISERLEEQEALNGRR
jgi:hypothetical protein